MANDKQASRYHNLKIRKIDTEPIESLSSLNPNFPNLYESQKHKVLLPEILKSTQKITGFQNHSKFLKNLTTSFEKTQREECDTPCFNKRRLPDQFSKDGTLES
jgi:hypothetical protein